MSLASVLQADFSAGIVRSVPPEQIPPNGVYDLQNLLLDDDGAVYERGGSAFLSGALGTQGLMGVWDVALAAGYRTVFLGAPSTANLGVLDVDDTTVVQVPGDPTYSSARLSIPTRAVVVDGVLVIPYGLASGSSPDNLLYGGSRKTSPYTTGTATATLASATVTGAGTLWSANADAGMILNVAGSQAVVKSVDSNTQLTLTRAWPFATAAGAAYRLDPIRRLGAVGVVGTAGKRLLLGFGSRVYFYPSSAAGGTGMFGTLNLLEDFHEMPGDVLAIEGLDNQAVVFTTAGMYMITGFDFDLTDDFANVQQAVRKVSEDVIVWGSAGCANWTGQLVVPTFDGCYLFSGGQLTDLTRSIAPLWQSYVTSGYVPGQAAVYRNTLFMPVLDSSNVVQDVLVCRLDRPFPPFPGATQLWWPWTRLGASGGGNMAAFTSRRRAAAVPKLLGASRASSSKVWDCTSFFSRDAGGLEADGTALTSILWTRSFRFGKATLKGVVKRVRVLHELVSASATADVAMQFLPAQAAAVSPSPQAPEEAGDDAFSWVLTDPACRTLYGAVKLTLAERSEKWKVKAVELLFRDVRKT